MLGRLVWAAIARPANVLVRVDINPLLLVLLGVAALMIMLALAIWPSRRAARLRPADVLHAE